MCVCVVWRSVFSLSCYCPGTLAGKKFKSMLCEWIKWDLSVFPLLANMSFFIPKPRKETSALVFPSRKIFFPAVFKC